MFARRTLILGITLVGAIAFMAVALHPLKEASAISQTGIKVTNIGATPILVAPIDVLTIKTTVASDVALEDEMAIKMTVRDELGQPVLEEEQTGIHVARDGKQTVYWTWRVPGRLHDGQYAIDMTVVGAADKVLAADVKDAAFTVERSEPVFASSTH